MDYFDLIEISGSERSTLYRALRKDGKTVLLKMARGGEINKVMLRREYEISKSLSHPGLPYVISYETDSLAGEFIVMEYVDGRTLDKFLESGPSLELRRNVFFQLLDVISYIHKCGIVHNDLKPQNIMVSNSSDSVKLIDFGMSADDSRFLAETAKGTPGYASPELFAGGPVDKRSDIWSIGAIMRDMFGTRYSRVSEKCLDLDPDGRYPSVGELKKAMGAQRSRTAMLVALPFILLILSISAFFLLRGRPDYDPAIAQAEVQVRQDLQVASGGEQEPSASPEVTATIPESSLAGETHVSAGPVSLPSAARNTKPCSDSVLGTGDEDQLSKLPQISIREADLNKMKTPVLSVEFSLPDEVMPPQVDFFYSDRETDPEKIVENGKRISARFDNNVASAVISDGIYCDIEYRYTARVTVGSTTQLLGVSSFRYDAPPGTVDLGLSVLWSTCNLGADSPMDEGDFYAWGETEPHYTGKYGSRNFAWVEGRAGWYENTYKFAKISVDEATGQESITFTKYNSTDCKIVLDTEDDAAYVKLGSNWRIPTRQEWIELCQYTDREEIKDVAEVVSYKFKSKISGLEDRYLIIRTVPYGKDAHLSPYIGGNITNCGYWTASRSYSESSAFKYIIGTNETNGGRRWFGRPIRPVYIYRE